MKLLIVGGGLAGTSLAHHLLKRGVDFEIIDNGNNVSSTVAGGILNPLVFRRMTLSWRLDELLPFAYNYYHELEALFGCELLKFVPIRRLFASEQERGYWEKKQSQEAFQAYMHIQTEFDKNFPSSLNTFGTGVVKQSGFVEAAKYIEYNLNYFEQLGKLKRESVDFSQMDPETGSYKGETYDYIVFCEGKDMCYNPWFGYLPMQQTKGEVLTIQSSEIDESESLNRKCFMMPIGNQQFRVGSTYDWDQDNVEITEKGRDAILENLKSVTDAPFTIVNQIAGVRPTVKDRRPFLGKHATYPKLAIGNGLGTKGYMIAPLIMFELMEYLLDGKELDKEVDIRRFDKL